MVGPAYAEDVDSPLHYAGSGFLTLAAGKVLSGTSDPATDVGFRCPCMISDYGHGGVYEAGGWQFGPDSLLGLQGTVAGPDGRFSITGQAVARGTVNGRASLEWLYGSADLDSRWTVQIGRKRLPLLAYSEVQDVGFAVPWAHLPPQIYGWEVVNYNGMNVLFRDQWREVSVQFNAFVGAETLKDTPYQKVYFGRDYRADTRWPGIRGMEAKLGRGGLELRGVYIQSDTQSRAVSDGALDYSPPHPQKIYGLSVGYDDTQWVGRGEILYIDRRQDYGADRASLIAVGRRVGPWLAMVSHSRYRQDTWASGEPAEGHDTQSLLLRREMSPESAVKLQLDVWRDRSAAGFASPHGERRVVTASYSRVF